MGFFLYDDSIFFVLVRHHSEVPRVPFLSPTCRLVKLQLLKRNPPQPQGIPRMYDRNEEWIARVLLS